LRIPLGGDLWITLVALHLASLNAAEACPSIPAVAPQSGRSPLE